MFENYRECKHCIDGMKNGIGETLAFCELWGEWRNITLGDCMGNCESQEECIDISDNNHKSGCFECSTMTCSRCIHDLSDYDKSVICYKCYLMSHFKYKDNFCRVCGRKLR